MVELHRAEQPWKLAKFDKTDGSVEAKKERLLRKVRSILNRITPTNEEKLTGAFCRLKVYERPEGVLDEAISILFQKAVDDPKYCLIYARLCRKQIVDELANYDSVSSFRNALLFRVQRNFNADKSNDAQRAANPVEAREFVRNFKRRRLGLMRFIGYLHSNNVVSVRIVDFCVHHLLETVKGGAREVDNDSVEYAIKLLEVIGKRLAEPAMGEVPFPLERTFQILRDAMPIVNSRIRYLIMGLVELRESGWVPRTAEEVPVKISSNKRPQLLQMDNQIENKNRKVQDRAGTNNAEKNEVVSSTKMNSGPVDAKEQALVDTSSFDELTDECCCAVCSEIFDSIKFIPRSLDCGHDFCQACIYKMRINAVVKCPTCQRITNLPADRELPIFYKLIGIADKVMKSRVAPKIACKSCGMKFSSKDIRMCTQKDCEMFNQLLCVTCALDGGHGGHVVKYDVKVEQIKTDMRNEVAEICSQIGDKKRRLLQKGSRLATMADALGRRIAEVNIPDQIIGQIETIASEQDAAEFKEIVLDLANTVMCRCTVVEEAFDHSLRVAKEQFQLLDNKNGEE